MYSCEKLEKILNEKIISIDETSYGISNKNILLLLKIINTFIALQKILRKLMKKIMKKKLWIYLKMNLIF